MELNNFDQLVNKVTATVLSRLDVAVDSLKKTKSCLIIQPQMSFGIHEYLDYITKHYPGYELYFGTYDIDTVKQYMNKYKKINYISISKDETIYKKVVEYVQNIVIIGPKMNLLKALTQVDDGDDINHIILGSLVSHKNVSIIVNLNDTIAQKLSATLTDLRDMGIHIINLQKQEVERKRADLITESYVVDLKRNGIQFISLDKKQLLTPLAKDKLREYKIGVKYIEEANHDHK